MGCFAYTCAISGLPIDSGDKVRYLLLTKNPYFSHAGSIVMPDGEWFPRTFPIKAWYNDYGSVEHINDVFGKQLWLDGLKADLVELKLGNNEYHDVPVSKNGTFEELLHALIEGRVAVRAAGKELPVSPAMIREDVWQALLSLPIQKDPKLDSYSLKEINNAAKVVWNSLDPDDQFFHLAFIDSDTRPFVHNDLPGTSGLATAFRIAIRRRAEMSEQEIQTFLQSSSELIYINSILYSIRYAWRPSYSCGSQVGEWGVAREWHNRLAEISNLVEIKK